MLKAFDLVWPHKKNRYIDVDYVFQTKLDFKLLLISMLVLSGHCTGFQALTECLLK